MDVAADVIELFTTREPARASEIALKLNQLNADRQLEEARVLAKIEEFMTEDGMRREPYCLVLHGEGWHRGVIGIVATRVVERYGRPALVVSSDAASGEAHGSGRSIPAFHLLDALESDRCRHLFTRFGGHAHAVGFALPAANLPALAAALDSYARERLRPKDFEPLLEIDGEIELAAIDGKFLRSLEQLEPFGLGNRAPVFVVRGARLKQPPQVMKERHLKLRIGPASGPGKCFDALGWRMAERLQTHPLAVADSLDLAFTLEDSSNPDFPGLQLRLRDYAPVAAAVAVAAAQPVS
jgi:single-stranded-DNA-specific exonuclease